MGIINLRSPFGYGVQNGDYIDFSTSEETSDTLIVVPNNFIPIRTVECPKCGRFAWDNKEQNIFVHRLKIIKNSSYIQLLNDEFCKGELTND